jgi:hypothetical protein
LEYKYKILSICQQPNTALSSSVFQRHRDIIVLRTRSVFPSLFLQYQITDTRVTLKRNFLGMGLYNADWTHMAEDSDKWRTLVDTAMSLLIPKNSELSEQMRNHWVLKLTLFYEVN